MKNQKNENIKQFFKHFNIMLFRNSMGGVNAQTYPTPLVVDSTEDLRIIIYPITICDDLLHPVDPPSYGAPIPSFCTSTYCERNYRPTITILYDLSSSSSISADFTIEYKTPWGLGYSVIDSGTITIDECFKPWLYGSCNSSYTITDSLMDIYGTGNYRITVSDNQTSNSASATQYYISPEYNTNFSIQQSYSYINTIQNLEKYYSHYNTPNDSVSLICMSVEDSIMLIDVPDEVKPNSDSTYCYNDITDEYECGPPLQIVIYSADSTGTITSDYIDTFSYQDLFNNDYDLNQLTDNRIIDSIGKAYYLIKSEYTGEGDFYLGDTLCGEYIADSWKFVKFAEQEYKIKIPLSLGGASSTNVYLEDTPNSLTSPIPGCMYGGGFTFTSFNELSKLDSIDIQITQYDSNGNYEMRNRTFSGYDTIEVNLDSIDINISEQFFSLLGTINLYGGTGSIEYLKTYHIEVKYYNQCGENEFDYWYGGNGYCKTDFSTANSEEESNMETNNFIEAIYPNPASTVLNIEFSNNEIKSDIKIIDITGKIVLTSSINNEDNNKKATIDVSNLTKGIYFINFKTTNGIKTEKVIIQ